MAERFKGKERDGERWTGASANLIEISLNLYSLQKLLIKKTVYVDGETFNKASRSSEQARAIKKCLNSIWKSCAQKQDEISKQDK